jgi:hypothetical protein
VFHRRIRNNPTPKSMSVTVPWTTLLYVLYASSALIMIRSIYRVAEYVEGQGGELQSKEFWLYIFDSLPMVVVALLFNWMHPSKVISGKSRDGALEGAYMMEGGTVESQYQLRENK